jgi:hypothetical protein
MVATKFRKVARMAAIKSNLPARMEAMKFAEGAKTAAIVKMEVIDRRELRTVRTLSALL